MFYLTPSRNLGWLLISALIVSPAAAHTVQVSGDVAATLHVEPNHNPKAGQQARAWFALTRKGGQIISLSQCNCQLAVYSQPRTQSSQPLIRPSLKAITAEKYQGIPGAEMVFPRAGAYELELSGTPKAGAKFRPFRLTYTVTVGAGTSQNHLH
jgi:hypothetical protein